MGRPAKRAKTSHDNGSSSAQPSANATTPAAAKTPPNTPTAYYIDTPAVKKACHKNFETIDKACKQESDTPETGKQPALRKVISPALMQKIDNFKQKVMSKHSPKVDGDNAWMMSHCDGLWIKPDNRSFKDELKEFNDMLDSVSNDLDGAIKKTLEPMVEKLKEEAKDKAVEMAKDKAGKLAVRSGVRWTAGLAGAAAGGVGAAPTEAIATVWNAGDALVSGYDAAKAGYGAYKSIDGVQAMLEVFNKAKSELSDLAKTSKTPTEMMATGMGILSRLNECTRARRCLLVKYSETSSKASMAGHGCCPGQTGHHVIPDEMAKNGCSGYSTSGAPTICVEGATNGNGSHKKIHDTLEGKIDKHRKGGLFGLGASDKVDYEDARDYGVDSVRETFPESRCDPDCLKAQLDAYYKSKCLKPMPAVSGASGAERAPKDSKPDGDVTISDR
ncbi:HNH/endonuclease VII fold toxin-2 domain-containing protein [Pseudomonas sp. RIT-PI-AD]|uniref:HNH/endonuclease VII fold toxin-2 domain-containing protein n=1 Tax=Pseudomonas sp. RIT-PI-AD TaxID=3035294 RepID=UPI0021DAFA94|nr:HNH/endonuclease VII fold toxin-2 domain-containing protein [Pseudomonas sp. RIT-PI-AD]